MQKYNNKFKQRMEEIPVESHLTAAWADCESIQGAGRIFNPSLLGVEEAKEYVDENEK